MTELDADLIMETLYPAWFADHLPACYLEALERHFYEWGKVRDKQLYSYAYRHTVIGVLDGEPLWQALRNHDAQNRLREMQTW